MYPCQMVKDLQLGVGIFQEPGGALHDDAAVVGAKAAGLVRLFNAMEGVNLKAHTGVEAQPFNLLAHWSAVEIDVVVLDDVVDRNNVGETALGQTKPTNSPDLRYSQASAGVMALSLRRIFIASPSVLGVCIPCSTPLGASPRGFVHKPRLLTNREVNCAINGQ